VEELTGLLVVFAAAWIVITLASLVLARSGGWHALARHYAANGAFQGRRLHFQFAQFGGWVGYNGALTPGADAGGLFLSVWPLFRPGHAPLYVPWTEIRASQEKRWLGDVVALRFAAEPDAIVRISMRLADRLAQASGHPLP